MRKRRGWLLIELATSSLRPGLANWHSLSRLRISDYLCSSASSRPFDFFLSFLAFSFSRQQGSIYAQRVHPSSLVHTFCFFPFLPLGLLFIKNLLWEVRHVYLPSRERTIESLRANRSAIFSERFSTRECIRNIFLSSRHETEYFFHACSV